MTTSSPDCPLKSTREYEVKKTLGEGAFGRAALVHRKRDKAVYVVKEIKERLGSSDKDKVLRELDVLYKVDNYFVVKLHGHFLESGQLHLVMEYCESDLQKEIDRRKNSDSLFTENEIRNILKQMVYALEYLHESKKVIHRDIKPANIFLNVGATQVKLGDFGLAKIADGISMKHTVFVGTIAYLSPEICRFDDYSFKTDIWSLGVVAYEMCEFDLPFSYARSREDYMKAIKSNEPKPLRSGRSDKIRKLVITKMMHKQPESRPSTSQILRDEFLTAVTVDDVGTGSDDNHNATANSQPASINSSSNSDDSNSGNRYLGCRVVRSSSWKWEEQDGGEGCVGTVVAIRHGGNEAIVVWDMGKYANYRCSQKVGGCDLKILDNAGAGVIWSTIKCDTCGENPLRGMRWICLTCTKKMQNDTFDMCTFCYHSNKHDLDHEFVRWADKDSEKVKLAERLPRYRKEAKGLFPGAVVVRGKDWVFGEQDGGAGNRGIVTKFYDEDSKNGGMRNAVEVKWMKNSYVDNYKIGMRNKVELRATTAECWIKYYHSDLPKLDLTNESDGNIGNQEGSSPTPEDALIQILKRLMEAQQQTRK